MTNGDWVRCMSNDELAQFIVKLISFGQRRSFNKTHVYQFLLSFLEKDRNIHLENSVRDKVIGNDSKRTYSGT